MEIILKAVGLLVALMLMLGVLLVVLIRVLELCAQPTYIAIRTYQAVFLPPHKLQECWVFRVPEAVKARLFSHAVGTGVTAAAASILLQAFAPARAFMGALLSGVSSREALIEFSAATHSAANEGSILESVPVGPATVCLLGIASLVLVSRFFTRPDSVTPLESLAESNLGIIEKVAKS